MAASGPGGKKTISSKTSKPKMTMLAKKSLAIQKKKN